MTNKYESYEDWWNAVQTNALIGLNEVLEHPEDNNVEERSIASVVAEDACEHSNMVSHYPQTIIFHTEQGFYGGGFERYITHRDFDNNPNSMIGALAKAAWYNEIRQAVENILENREALGEAYQIIEDEHPIWSDGVTFEYDYEKGLIEPTTHTYTLENVGEGCYMVIDPDGNGFENISPDVMIEDATIPSRLFKLKLDNICAKRQREREKANE